jgi:predicted metal-binding protein
MTDQMTPPAELLVCVKCRRAGDAPDDEIRPGTLLLEALNGSDLPPSITVKGVECLSNCSHGCSIALRGPGRWSYVYGNLHAAIADVVLDGAMRYQSTADGLVPWRERPEHFRKNCIARIPPLEA